MSSPSVSDTFKLAPERLEPTYGRLSLRLSSVGGARLLGFQQREVAVVTRPEDALHIASACNSHAALISACEGALRAMGRAGAYADLKHPQRKAWEACVNAVNGARR